MRNLSIGKTVANLMRFGWWVHIWLECFDAGSLDCLRDLPRPGRLSKIPYEMMARIIGQAVQPKCAPR